MTQTETPKSEKHWFLLIVFWVYVLIPLGWGISQTLNKAMKLFH
ncbi:MAG: hypothetical protein ACKVN9_06105 [Methylophilaceae bacterium]